MAPQQTSWPRQAATKIGQWGDSVRQTPDRPYTTDRWVTRVYHWVERQRGQRFKPEGVRDSRCHIGEVVMFQAPYWAIRRFMALGPSYSGTVLRRSFDNVKIPVPPLVLLAGLIGLSIWLFELAAVWVLAVAFNLLYMALAATVVHDLYATLAEKPDETKFWSAFRDAEDTYSSGPLTLLFFVGIVEVIALGLVVMLVAACLITILWIVDEIGVGRGLKRLLTWHPATRGLRWLSTWFMLLLASLAYAQVSWIGLSFWVRIWHNVIDWLAASWQITLLRVALGGIVVVSIIALVIAVRAIVEAIERRYQAATAINAQVSDQHSASQPLTAVDRGLLGFAGAAKWSGRVLLGVLDFFVLLWTALTAAKKTICPLIEVEPDPIPLALQPSGTTEPAEEPAESHESDDQVTEHRYAVVVYHDHGTIDQTFDWTAASRPGDTMSSIMTRLVQDKSANLPEDWYLDRVIHLIRLTEHVGTIWRWEGRQPVPTVLPVPAN